MAIKKPKYLSKDSKNSIVWSKRVFSLSILLLTLIFLILFLVKGFIWTKDKFFTENSKFEIQYINYNLDYALDKEVISDALASINVKKGVNLFSFDLKDIENCILTNENLAHISFIQLKRNIPNALDIKIITRDPIAKIFAYQKIDKNIEEKFIRKYNFLIDSKGYIFKDYNNLYKANLLPEIILHSDNKKKLYPGEQISNDEIEIAKDIISICKSSLDFKNFLPIKNIDFSRNNKAVILDNQVNRREHVIIRLNQTPIMTKDISIQINLYPNISFEYVLKEILEKYQGLLSFGDDIKGFICTKTDDGKISVENSEPRNK